MVVTVAEAQTARAEQDALVSQQGSTKLDIVERFSGRCGPEFEKGGGAGGRPRPATHVAVAGDEGVEQREVLPRVGQVSLQRGRATARGVQGLGRNNLVDRAGRLERVLARVDEGVEQRLVAAHDPPDARAGHAPDFAEGTRHHHARVVVLHERRRGGLLFASRAMVVERPEDLVRKHDDVVFPGDVDDLALRHGVQVRPGRIVGVVQDDHLRVWPDQLPKLLEIAFPAVLRVQLPQGNLAWECLW